MLTAARVIGPAKCARRLAPSRMSIGAEALKKNLEQLAVFGGEPAFADKLHVGRPNIGDIQHLKRLLDDILERRWLTNYGKYVQEFEQKLAGITGVKHCIAMCNGTIALEIAIRAAELKGEVIVPSMTFIATAHALQWQEITPVFCDIDPQTYNIDPRRIEEMITPRTTGIIGVHLYGRPCDIEALAHIAKRKRLKLIFDAAHAFGCSYHGKMIGGFGDAEVFSFHATKFINSFEGGAVLTNDDELARRIRLMKNFGFTGYDSVEYIGTNGKMTEIAAAMGLVSLQCLGRFVAANRRNYDQYAADLRGVPGVRLMAYDEESATTSNTSSWRLTSSSLASAGMTSFGCCTRKTSLHGATSTRVATAWSRTSPSSPCGSAAAAHRTAGPARHVHADRHGDRKEGGRPDLSTPEVLCGARRADFHASSSSAAVPLIPCAACGIGVERHG